MRPSSLLPILMGSALAFPTKQPETLAERDWPAVNDFLAKLGKLFPISVIVTESCGIIGLGQQTLASFFQIPSTENDACGDVTVLFARGTCDPGNVGVVTGPWFFRALENRLRGKSVGVRGFSYAASVDGFLTGSKDAGRAMANQIRQTIQECPSSKIVVSGFSQGAMVVHNAADNLDAATMAKVSSVVLFGDPYSRKPVANIASSKVKVICHAGDNICEGGSIILLPHLTYAGDADSAADFVASRL